MAGRNERAPARLAARVADVAVLRPPVAVDQRVGERRPVGFAVHEADHVPARDVLQSETNHRRVFGMTRNLRFRHAGATRCNCLFTDGHVSALAKNEVLRNYFMIKWPPGVNRDPSQP